MRDTSNVKYIWRVCKVRIFLCSTSRTFAVKPAQGHGSLRWLGKSSLAFSLVLLTGMAVHGQTKLSWLPFWHEDNTIWFHWVVYRIFHQRFLVIKFCNWWLYGHISDEEFTISIMCWFAVWWITCLKQEAGPLHFLIPWGHQYKMIHRGSVV